MSAFADATLVFVDELLQNSKRKGNFVEADEDDVKLLRSQLEAREALTVKLADALRALVNAGGVGPEGMFHDARNALKAYEDSGK